MPRTPLDRRSPDGAAFALDVWLSFDDPRRAGIVDSWKTPGEWQRDPRVNSQRERLFARNTRRWSKQHEIDPWQQSRPIEGDAFDADPDAGHGWSPVFSHTLLTARSAKWLK
jgi:hypothetical protein